MSTGQISLGIIIFYLVAMLVITVWNGHKKKQKSAEGFFLANRGVSSVLLPLTMIAAMQSTFAFLGAPGMYYTHGIPYIVMVLSQVWVALMVVYFGNKIRILAKEKGYMSLGDYLQDRYKSKYLKVLASCISVLMTMVFLSMQYVGNARAMSIVSGNAISYTAAIIVSILFSLMYVLIGGAGGVVLLDAIQAVILMVGIVLAAWIAIAPVGGIKELLQGSLHRHRNSYQDQAHRGFIQINTGLCSFGTSIWNLVLSSYLEQVSDGKGRGCHCKICYQYPGFPDPDLWICNFIYWSGRTFTGNTRAGRCS